MNNVTVRPGDFQRHPLIFASMNKFPQVVNGCFLSDHALITFAILTSAQTEMEAAQFLQSKLYPIT